jgi:hypothetical protein
LPLISSSIRYFSSTGINIPKPTLALICFYIFASTSSSSPFLASDD